MKGGFTPLIAAASLGGHDSVIELLNSGADPNAVNNGGDTALHLIAAGASKPGVTYFENLLVRFIRAGFNPSIINKKKETVLRTAVEKENPSLFQALIQMGVYPARFCDDFKMTVVHYAVLSSDPSLLPLVLDRSEPAAMNLTCKEGLTPVMTAIRGGKTRLAKQMILAGADIQIATAPLGLTALHLAAQAGDSDLVEFLVANKARKNAVTTDLRYTPLHIAALSGRGKVISTLLRLGADLSALDLHGRSAVTLAESALNLLQTEAAETRNTLIAALEQAIQEMKQAEQKKAETQGPAEAGVPASS